MERKPNERKEKASVPNLDIYYHYGYYISCLCH